MDNYILEKATYYYYDKLSAHEQNWYKVFLYNILNMKNVVDVTEQLFTEQIQRITRAIINDRPDIFWYRGSYTMTTRDGIIVRVTFKFAYSLTEVRSIIHEIEGCSLYKEINRYMLTTKSDLKKALCVYECIIKNTEYEYARLLSSNSNYDYAYGIEGVLLKKRAVCTGYAKAFQYFSNKQNIFCTIVTGRANGERHAWNLINLYGSYYYVDTTWGDPTFVNKSEKSDDYISYDYFCITTEELRRSHHPVFDVEMPLCVDTKYNYYRYFGLVEDSYSIESVAKHIINAKKQRKKEAVIKYSSKGIYTIAVSRLFANSEIFDAFKIAQKYCNIGDVNKISYNADDDALIIEIKIC